MHSVIKVHPLNRPQKVHQAELGLDIPHPQLMTIPEAKMLTPKYRKAAEPTMPCMNIAAEPAPTYTQDANIRRLSTHETDCGGMCSIADDPGTNKRAQLQPRT